MLVWTQVINQIFFVNRVFIFEPKTLSVSASVTPALKKHRLIVLLPFKLLHAIPNQTHKNHIAHVFMQAFPVSRLHSLTLSHINGLTNARAISR